MRRWLSNHSKSVAAAMLALFCASFGRWLLQPASAPGAALVHASYDSYYRWFKFADGPPPHSPVVIVYLDLESHLALRQDPTRAWPRELYAQLLRRLTAAGARAVVFDVVFDSEGTNAVANRDLTEAVTAHGRVVLAGELSTSGRVADEGVRPVTTRLAQPMESFRNAAAAWGLGEVGVDDDFVARQHFAGRSAEGEATPSLTWAAGRALSLAATAATNAAKDIRWFRYYGPPISLPHVSFAEALDPQSVNDAVFRDRIVFIGARPMAGIFKERRDEFRSPFHSWRERNLFMPGVEVHATQMLNLLRGDWLKRPPKAVELLWIAVLGGLFGGGLIWLRPVPATAVAVAGAGVVTLTAAGLFREASLWFPWLIVVAAQIPAALGGSILFNSLEWYRARRRLEADKRAADARIREQAALIDKAQDAILVQRLDGGFTYANPSAERLYGWALKEWQDGAAEKAFGDAQALEARRLASENGEWNGELRQHTRSGKAITVESRWTLLRDEAGTPTGLLIINSDVTEKKQLEAETLRMQRMEAIGALAGGMAHDLNNALAPVLMGTQLLRRDAKDENSRRVLSLMEASTRRGADMVRQVLLFARGKQGDFERLETRPLVKEMEKLARDTFPPNITVSAHVADDLWPVRGNATQLHQVLLNLCVNARDAMPEGGALALAADNVELSEAEASAIREGRPGSFVVLMVSDTGTGIAPEWLPKIFEPFFTTKPEGRGTGLGLSTTVRIVKAHGGFLAVESRQGEGTTFEIYLPRFEEAPTAAPPDAAPAPRGRGEIILVADDDEAVRELLRRSLEEQGYRVLLAANGAEAVSQFLEHSGEVALFLSERSMPVMDGAQAASVMQQSRPRLPVLFLGAEGDPTTVAAAGHSAGPPLHKPIEMDDLFRAVARTIG